jgi:hemoglobin
MQFQNFSPIIEVPFGQRAEVKRPLPEFYATIGETGVRDLVDRHYELLKVSEISDLFPVEDPEEFAAAKKHAADFFIQFLGGPPYFNQSRGAPRMVGRHAPFRITPSARRVWLETYAVALQDVDASPGAVSSFWDYLNTFSTWMVNTPE